MTSIIFCANISRGLFTQYRGVQFNTFLQALRQYSDVPVYLAYNQNGGDIESRARSFKQQIDTIMRTNKLHSCNLVGYSLAGLDIRLAAASTKYIKTITTIGTPNRGSTLSNLYVNQRLGREYVDPICKIIGVESKYFEEVNTENITQFNLFTPNVQGIKYFSIGGHIHFKFASDVFRFTTNYIEEKLDRELPSLSDGVSLEEETRWGKHLLTCESDHASLVGLKSQKVGELCASIVSQNIDHQYKLQAAV